MWSYLLCIYIYIYVVICGLNASCGSSNKLNLLTINLGFQVPSSKTYSLISTLTSTTPHKNPHLLNGCFGMLQSLEDDLQPSFCSICFSPPRVWHGSLHCPFVGGTKSNQRSRQADQHCMMVPSPSNMFYTTFARHNEWRILPETFTAFAPKRSKRFDDSGTSGRPDQRLCLDALPRAPPHTRRPHRALWSAQWSKPLEWLMAAVVAGHRAWDGDRQKERSRGWRDHAHTL